MNYTEEDFQGYLARLREAAKTLTQDQIEACAWVMGGSGCGWNREKVIEALTNETKA